MEEIHVYKVSKFLKRYSTSHSRRR